MSLTQQEAMNQILVSFGQGAGSSVVIAPGAAVALQTRYFAWLVAVKPGQTQSPLQAWDNKGADFEGRFRAMGSRAASLSTAGTIDAGETLTAAFEIEAAAESDCPFCPPPPPRTL